MRPITVDQRKTKFKEHNTEDSGAPCILSSRIGLIHNAIVSLCASEIYVNTVFVKKKKAQWTNSQVVTVIADRKRKTRRPDMLPTPGTTNQRNRSEMNACFVSACNSSNVSNTLLTYLLHGAESLRS